MRLASIEAMGLFRSSRKEVPPTPPPPQRKLVWLRIPGATSVQTPVLRNTPTELVIELPSASTTFAGSAQVIFEQGGHHWLLEAPVARVDLSGRFPALALQKLGSRLEQLPERRREDRRKIVLPLELRLTKTSMLKDDAVVPALTTEINGVCEIVLFSSRLPFAPGDRMRGALTLRDGEPTLPLEMELIRVDSGFAGGRQTCVARVKQLGPAEHERMVAFLETLAG